MATANISYLSTYSVPEKTRLRQAVYTWSLIGFSLLDVILLFWLLNPLAGPSAHQHKLLGTPTQFVADNGGEAVGPKPSPLGSIVVHKAKAPARTRVSSARPATQPSF